MTHQNDDSAFMLYIKLSFLYSVFIQVKTIKCEISRKIKVKNKLNAKAVNLTLNLTRDYIVYNS